jgi:hypothetical protein
VGLLVDKRVRPITDFLYYGYREIEESRSRKKKKIQPKDDSGQLWVDKYRPTSYMDLMGDQRINRDVLRWVKQWDYCVFKKNVKKESQRDKQLKHYKSTFGAEPKFAAYKKDVKETNDPLLRPEKRVCKHGCMCVYQIVLMPGLDFINVRSTWFW